MAAFQGWGSGPNFAPAAAAMTQATQIEEERRARQSEQIRSAFEGLRDERRRREDQAIAATAAKQAQKNTELDRLVNLYSAQGTRINNLMRNAPKQSDYITNMDEYQPAVDRHNRAVKQLIDQQNQLAANNS